jgi:hypothetical protein
MSFLVDCDGTSRDHELSEVDEGLCTGVKLSGSSTGVEGIS